MIKVETEKGAISIEVEGNLSEILADLTTIMTEIYTELPDELHDTYLNCISECVPNLIRKSSGIIGKIKSNDDKSLEEAAEIAMALLKWRDGDDFNLPD